MAHKASGLFLVAMLGCAAITAAQGNPTGAVRGQIVDADDLPVPGASVAVASEVLQGTRTTVTFDNGEFVTPFLPPGEYTLTVALDGFRTHTERVGVAIAETLPVRIVLSVATVAETVSVVATASTEITKTPTVGETYTADLLERLPIARTMTAATLLAPGVTPNGPSGEIVISGALSYENLFLIDGVTVNENLRGQPLPLFIEDAIQETKVSTGGISAEYGRFAGGVVNMLTKSGGNRFSGSFRTAFTNDAWRALTPYPGDHTFRSVTPTYQVTVGGPVRRNKVWFFGAGRMTRPAQNQALDYTGVNYLLMTKDARGEGKVTYALGTGDNLKASYSRRAFSTRNNSFGQVMDLASLYDNRFDQNLTVVNYTNVLNKHFFLEGQYSKKVQITRDSGSRFTDLTKGTPIWDRSRNQASFNSPRFCAVCGNGWLEHRDNWDWFAKLNYFGSTGSAGSHNVVMGLDNFMETRKNDNWQSGSGYRIQATTARIDGVSIFPIFNTGTTFIDYLPLVAESVGNDIRTYSAFVNDAWQYSGSVSLNIGFRYDRNRSKDQTGLPAVRDWNLSPRLGFTWNITGDGHWILNAGLARYVASISTALVDAGSAGGRTASYSFLYQGPPINAGSGPYLPSDRALSLLFDWFFANGGLNRATRNAPTIPGLTNRVESGLKAPNSGEYTIGLARDIGRRGTWRLDYLSRNYHDMYGDVLTTRSGRVTDATGRQYDFAIVKNNPDAKRTYRSAVANVTYRWPSIQAGGNYTLSWSRGNVDGEDVATGPTRTNIGTYPEYRQATWNSPIGYNPNDQRHKVRGWLYWTMPLAQRLGDVTLGLIHRVDSAQPYDAKGVVDPRSYVANPGYVTPPSTVIYYFGPRNGLRWDATWNTDVALNWSRRVPLLGIDVFFRGVVTNIFNDAAIQSGDSTILTAASPGSRTDLRPFDPFTTVPIAGVNWDHGPDFGRPSSVDSHQRSRTFSFSVGVRY